MKIVILEDEVKTARALQQMIGAVQPDAEVIAVLQSVQAAVDFFKKNNTFDLVFMDVQLADGLCFNIFKEVTIPAPVIFCTAFDEYAIEGFKANGIDYILKPFTEATLKAAFDKFKALQNFFQVNPDKNMQLEKILQSLQPDTGKKSFLVFKQKKYSVVPVEQIAFFFIKNDLPALRTFDGQDFFINQSLDAVSAQLPAAQFYRITRQYLVNFNAVKEVEPYFSRKLLVRLKVATPESLLINKNKTTDFLNWLDNR